MEPVHKPGGLIQLLHRLKRPPRGATLIVWGAAVLGLLQLATLDSGGVRVTGYVAARSYQIAARTSGRIASVAADLQQDVRAGQVVAALDDADSKLSVAAANADLARLRADRAKATAALHAAQQERAAQHRAELRRFDGDREQAHLELLRARTLLAEDDSRLDRLDLELRQLTELGTELVAPDRLQDKRLQRETLATRVQGLRALVAEHETLYARARARADEFGVHDLVTSAAAIELAPYDEAITAQEARLAQLRRTEDELALRAPVAGKVAAILRRPGEVVAAGEPILTVIEHEPSAVVAHLPQEYLQRVVPGVAATLLRHGQRAMAFEAVVTHQGAAVEPLPVRADASSPVPRWGFPVHLTCPQGAGLIAGEEFTVVFHDGAGVAAAPGH